VTWQRGGKKGGLTQLCNYTGNKTKVLCNQSI